jgi:hypothetical protein
VNVDNVVAAFLEQPAQATCPSNINVAPAPNAVHRDSQILEIGGQLRLVRQDVADLDVDGSTITSFGRRHEQSLGAPRAETLDQPQNSDRAAHAF